MEENWFIEILMHDVLTVARSEYDLLESATKSLSFLRMAMQVNPSHFTKHRELLNCSIPSQSAC